MKLVILSGNQMWQITHSSKKMGEFQSQNHRGFSSAMFTEKSRWSVRKRRNFRTPEFYNWLVVTGTMEFLMTFQKQLGMENHPN